MATNPGLYLKWRAFRELVGMPLPESEIAFQLFGEGGWEGSAPKFSKLLYGDYGFSLETATKLATIVNKRLEASLQARGLTGLTEPLVPSEFTLPLYEFIRRVQSAARIEDDETLDRAQDALLGELAPGVTSQGAVRLVIEKFAADRSFDGFLPSGGDGPVVFKAGRHKGRIAVCGIEREPAMAYTLLARDTRPIGRRSWDLSWRETILWLPSPSLPRLVDGKLLLMPDAAPVQPKPGRFLATTALLWDADCRGLLDPRGMDAEPGALDEEETARFLTNLRRLQRRYSGGVTVSSAEYIVIV
ncbi:hypothetical protein [Xanthobacter sp. VNH20]|uniref:hypothetical protein n=1 Tax=Xanthobacter sp. VNH20 TaxID=3156616 RepID=UPI0032B4C060